MFKTARIQLTLLYLLIIMLVSCLFSIAFFKASTQEIQRIVDRIQHDQEQRLEGNRLPPPPGPPLSVEELRQSQYRLAFSLILINGFIIIAAGGSGYFLAGKTLRPIRKMIDEQNQFISDASHELRTPIAVMRAEMESSLMEKNITNNMAKLLIKSNLEELTALQNLANGLLKISQLQQNDASLNFQKINLKEIILLTIEKIKPLATKKNITIKSELTDLWVMGNADNLKELIIIVLDNAIKYSHNQTAITIKSELKNNWAIVKIKDQGIGIASKDIEHIFDRFYRADASRSKAEGFGLGLPIAQKIVLLHHGQISCHSEINKGTVFTLKLPLSI